MDEEKESLELLNLIAQVIFDKKGMNILALDLRKVSAMSNYFLIAEGGVARHVQALGDEVVQAMAKKGRRPSRVDGERDSDWMILDFGDIMIHLFVPELRERYALEKLWGQGEIVDLKIDIGKSSPAAEKWEQLD